MTTFNPTCVPQWHRMTQVKPEIEPQAIDGPNPGASRLHSTHRVGSANFCRPRS